MKTTNLRLRAEFIDEKRPDTGGLWPPEVRLVIENTRLATAHVQAAKSCIIDHERGVQHLYPTDLVLPPREWTQTAWPLRQETHVTSKGSGIFIQTTAIRTLVLGQPRRMILAVVWDDGTNESLDFTIEAVEDRPEPSGSIAQPVRMTN